MFKEVYLTIAACFQLCVTAMISGSRKAWLACYSYPRCANMSHNQTLCLQWRAISSLPKRTLLLLAVSRALFAGPGSDSMLTCQRPDCWPLCSKLKGGSKLPCPPPTPPPTHTRTHTYSRQFVLTPLSSSMSSVTGMVQYRLQLPGSFNVSN